MDTDETKRNEFRHNHQTMDDDHVVGTYHNIIGMNMESDPYSVHDQKMKYLLKARMMSRMRLRFLKRKRQEMLLLKKLKLLEAQRKMFARNRNNVDQLAWYGTMALQNSVFRASPPSIPRTSNDAIDVADLSFAGQDNDLDNDDYGHHLQYLQVPSLAVSSTSLKNPYDFEWKSNPDNAYYHNLKGGEICLNKKYEELDDIVESTLQRAVEVTSFSPNLADGSVEDQMVPLSLKGSLYPSSPGKENDTYWQQNHIHRESTSQFQEQTVYESTTHTLEETVSSNDSDVNEIDEYISTNDFVVVDSGLNDTKLNTKYDDELDNIGIDEMCEKPDYELDFANFWEDNDEH
jgi:hypothetical protein